MLEELIDDIDVFTASVDDELKDEYTAYKDDVDSYFRNMNDDIRNLFDT